METNLTVQLVIAILEGGGLATFFYFALKGLRKQIQAQNETLNTMQIRIAETDKIKDLYKSMIDSLPDDINKFKEITTKLKDETIRELQEAYNGKHVDPQNEKIVASFEKFEKALEQIETIKKDSDEISDSTTFKYSFSHNYSHLGWTHKDIPVSIAVTQETNLIARVVLAKIHQAFRIYFRVHTSSGHDYWIGYGDGQNKNYKSKVEFTREINYNNKDIFVMDNINYAYRLGFPEHTDVVDKIVAVRLRASDTDRNSVKFSFRFVNK